MIPCFAINKSNKTNISSQVGAASKGIIQRDFQHHATVYKSPYAKNPFDQVCINFIQQLHCHVMRLSCY